MIWHYGAEELKNFLNHLINIHTNIQFTMDSKSNGHLPFQGTDMYRRPDGSLGHSVYRKPTHTNLYIHAESYHHPDNKQSMLSNLVHHSSHLQP